MNLRARSILVCSALLLLPHGAAFADAIDDFIRSEMAKRDIAGLSLAVIQDGKIVKACGYGVVDKMSGTPVTTETLFQAGSISKSVAAMGALKLVEQGKLSLDDPINRYLRSWKVPENDLTKQAPVTLRRILSHTAGMTVHGFPGYDASGPVPSLIEVLNGAKPANTAPIRVDIVPGSQWRYSGGGYTVMQQAMIDVTGRPFEELMRDSVLKPLGMSSSTYQQPLPHALAVKTASGYYQESKPVPGRWHIYPEMAAAGLWTTASDLAKFAIGVQRSFSGSSNPVITREMTRKMLTVEKQGGGLGLFLGGAGRELRFSHNGRDDGFDANMVAYAQTGQGAVIMINANEDSRMVSRMLEVIAKEYHWPGYPISPAYRTITDKDPQLTARLKTLLSELASGRYDRSLFTPDVQKVIDQQLGQGMRLFLTRLGPVQSVELVERNDQGAGRACRYRVTYPKTTMLMPLTVNRDGKIATITLEPE